jgi:Secretion system C-terminal sorting domain
MKRNYLLFFLLLCFARAHADNERVCVITGGPNACTANDLGYVNPCSQIVFVAIFDVPSGYDVASKFEWYVNSVLVKTSTNPLDPTMTLQVTSSSISVYCIITYKRGFTTSSPVTTGTFVPHIKHTNFGSVTTSTDPPVYGCANTVSYSLNTTSCPALCDSWYTVPTNGYTITWQAPSGWTQTSISTYGNDVSFQPDATSLGTLTATITLPCGYTETRTFNVTRTAPPTEFSALYQFCTSPGSVTIGAMCGATDYTYTITGYPGVTFVSNGLTSLTTSATSVNVNVPSGSTSNIIKVKANYPGGHSSTDASSTINTGPPIIFNSYYGTIEGVFTLNEATGAGEENQFCYHGIPTDVSTAMNFLGSGTVEWEKISGGPGGAVIWSQDGDNLVMAFKSIINSPVFRITITNECGSNSKDYKFVPVDCDLMFRVSPNPSSSNIQLSIIDRKDIKSSKDVTANRSFSAVKIFDMQGNLKKQLRFNQAKQANIDISNLPRGPYVIEISNGKYSERQHVLIQN